MRALVAPTPHEDAMNVTLICMLDCDKLKKHSEYNTLGMLLQRSPIRVRREERKRQFPRYGRPVPGLRGDVVVALPVLADGTWCVGREGEVVDAVRRVQQRHTAASDAEGRRKNSAVLCYVQRYRKLNNIGGFLHSRTLGAAVIFACR